jgi:hypothetical protein
VTKPSSSGDVFGFLNKVNESQQESAGKGNIGSVGSIGSGGGRTMVPNSVIASQQRAAAHKTTKTSKFF